MMLQRCLNPKNTNYRHYGGRGIIVCQRWKDSFAVFAEDMGQRPSARHTIDRVDVNGNYEPGNCRWATAKEQARNTRANRMIEFNGEVLPLAAWAERMGINAVTLHSRLARKWPIDRAFTEAIRG